MATAIHIEIDALFLLILCVIAWQITNSVSKQTGRILFRYVVYGIMTILFLDILWMLIDGKLFPGAILLNKIVNAIILGMSVTVGSLWYQYVLESLGYKIPHAKARLLMVPGIISFLLNVLSIWTGWIFTITENNIYVRGPWFSKHAVLTIVVLFVSLIHLLIELVNPKKRVPIEVIIKLLSFYIVPVIGTLWSLPYTGMPGTWTCASVSVILIYMNDQEGAILRDSLTGLNNRKTLDNTFASYIRQVNETKKLYLFLFDLDNFKMINDTLGHPVGDQALVDTAQILTDSVSGLQGLVARYGGDEFIMMGFFDGEPSVLRFIDKVRNAFDQWNKTHDNPYTLSTSVGFDQYFQGESLEDMICTADEKLYEDKHSRKVGR